MSEKKPKFNLNLINTRTRNGGKTLWNVTVSIKLFLKKNPI